jgi:hypothetical protein
MIWLVVWLIGLLLAVLTANVSIYLLLSAGLFGWRWYERMKRLGRVRRLEIPSASHATLELRWSEVEHEDGRRGRGLVLARVGERQAVRPRSLSPVESRLRIVPLVAMETPPDALASSDFEVGREVRLVLGHSETEAPPEGSIAVWNRTGTLQAGFVSANVPGYSALAEELAGKEPPRAFILWETIAAEGARVGARILIVYAGAPLRVTAKRQKTL